MSAAHFTVTSNGVAADLPPHLRARFDRDQAYAELQAEIIKRRTLQVKDASIPLAESVDLITPDIGMLWGDMLDMFAPHDSAWMPIGNGRYERKDGLLWPFYWTEPQLDLLRSASRFVATYNGGHGAGFIGSYCGYIIGKGMQCKPVPIASGPDGSIDPADAQLVKEAEKELQEFSDRTLWPEKQVECFNASLIDGDTGIWMFDLGDHLEIRRVGGEYIRQPMASNVKEFGFGVHTPPDDVQHHLGYHIVDGDHTEGVYVSTDDFVFLPFMRPGGWDSTLRRGIPIFMGVGKESVDCAAKILRNMGEGVAIRQQFAYIEEQAEGTSRDDSSANANFNADVIQRDSIGGSQQSTRPIRKARPGYVPQVTAGYKFQPPPGHPETESAINVVDALIRSVCSMLSCPAWMGGASGRDAMAYEAELVKDAPLVKSGEVRQEQVGNRFLKVMRKVLAIAVRCGRLRPETLTRLRLTMEHPQMAAQDPDKIANRHKTYLEMGVISPQQIQQEIGVDGAKQRAETSEFNKWKAQQQQANPQEPLPNPFGGKDAPPTAPPAGAGPAPAKESTDDPLGCTNCDESTLTEEERLRDADPGFSLKRDLGIRVKEGAPGPAPRPGLVWNDATHRWHRPEHEGGGEAPAPDAVRHVYDRSGDTSVPYERIQATLAHLEDLGKAELLPVAEKMELAGMAGKSAKYIRQQIAQKILDRRSAAQRDEMISGKIEHEELLKDLSAINVPDKRSGLPPMIPELYDQLKSKHPEMTEPEFHDALYALRDQGKIVLQGHNDPYLLDPQMKKRLPLKTKGAVSGAQQSGYAGWLHIPAAQRDEMITNPPAQESLAESAKLERCVAKVKAAGTADDPWAVCRVSVGESEDEPFTGIVVGDDGIRRRYVDGRLAAFKKPDANEWTIVDDKPAFTSTEEIETAAFQATQGQQATVPEKSDTEKLAKMVKKLREGMA